MTPKPIADFWISLFRLILISNTETNHFLPKARERAGQFIIWHIPALPCLNVRRGIPFLDKSHHTFHFAMYFFFVWPKKDPSPFLWIETNFINPPLLLNAPTIWLMIVQKVKFKTSYLTLFDSQFKSFQKGKTSFTENISIDVWSKKAWEALREVSSELFVKSFS